MKHFPLDFIKNEYLMAEKPTIKKNVKTLHTLPKRRKFFPIPWIGKMYSETSQM